LPRDTCSGRCVLGTTGTGPTATCNSNGDWQITTASNCIGCLGSVSAPAGRNAGWVTCNNRGVGATCQGVCNPGTTGTAPVATCGSDLQWSVTTPASCTATG
jgi:hypothetical protein